MDQDELEDEIFTKTIWTHVTMFSDFIRNHTSDWDSLPLMIHRREFFVYSMAVIFLVMIWLIHLGVLCDRFEVFNSFSRGIGSLGNSVWQETDLSGTASGNALY